jgi:hypothetical protein
MIDSARCAILVSTDNPFSCSVANKGRQEVILECSHLKIHHELYTKREKKREI